MIYVLKAITLKEDCYGLSASFAAVWCALRALLLLAQTCKISGFVEPRDLGLSSCVAPDAR